MSINEDLKRWEEIDETIQKMNVVIYGFDISKLSVKDQNEVKEQAKRRQELEAIKERINPKPKADLSTSELLKVRRLEALEAKFQKIAKGKPMKELSNSDLEKQLKVLKAMIKN